jgi:hypothetical protein
MYQDLYLSFESEEAANTVLFTKVPTDWDEDDEVVAWETRPNYQNIDIIGIIYKPTGESDEEGYDLMYPLPGWHVNVRLVAGEDVAVLEPFKVEPSTPMRVWG